MYLEFVHFMLVKFQIDDMSITLLTFNFHPTQVHGQASCSVDRVVTRI